MVWTNRDTPSLDVSTSVGKCLMVFWNLHMSSHCRHCLKVDGALYGITHHFCMCDVGIVLCSGGDQRLQFLDCRLAGGSGA